MPVIPLLSILAVLVCWPIAPTRAQDAIPVEIGGDGESDACPSQGQIARLDPAGDTFLSVREGPSSKHREGDRLGPGALVTICEERGAWLGIVYPTAGRDVDCGLSSPRAKRATYRGPCRSGWVHSRFVEVVAG